MHTKTKQVFFREYGLIHRIVITFSQEQEQDVITFLQDIRKEDSDEMSLTRMDSTNGDIEVYVDFYQRDMNLAPADFSGHIHIKLSKLLVGKSVNYDGLFIEEN